MVQIRCHPIADSCCQRQCWVGWAWKAWWQQLIAPCYN